MASDSSLKILLAIIVALLSLIGIAVVNAQAPPPPGPPIAATSSIGFLVNGLPIAAEPNLNLAPGSGMIWSAKDNPSASRVDVTPNYNSAFIATLDQVHYNLNFCESTNGTTAYACQLPYRTLPAYQRGETFLLVVDATCATSCTLNVDAQGVTSIKQADGLTDPGGTLVAGRAKLVWYDGNIFRLM